jgi:CheY-like chemotaxis protein
MTCRDDWFCFRPARRRKFLMDGVDGGTRLGVLALKTEMFPTSQRLGAKSGRSHSSLGERKAPSASPSPGELKPARILVVEDEPGIRMAVIDALCEAGYEVIGAASADDAWRYLQIAPKIDLVFSDIRTPGHLDGVDLAKLIGSHFPQMLIMLATGYNTRIDVSKGLQVLYKPYQLDVLVQLVAATLQRAKKRL